MAMTRRTRSHGRRANEIVDAASSAVEAHASSGVFSIAVSLRSLLEHAEISGFTTSAVVPISLEASTSISS